VCFSDLASVKDREVFSYSISCKSLNNIDRCLEWIVNHTKNAKKNGAVQVPAEFKQSAAAAPQPSPAPGAGAAGAVVASESKQRPSVSGGAAGSAAPAAAGGAAGAPRNFAMQPMDKPTATAAPAAAPAPTAAPAPSASPPIGLP
jgi:hypothetical protein